MSGSKDKKTRKNLKEQGLHIDNPREAAEAQKARKQMITYRIVFIAFLAVTLIVLYMNSGFYYRVMPAMDVNGRSYSIAEYDYYYRSAYLNEMTNGYGSYFIDTSTPLADQTYLYDTSMTWDDYFSDQAEANIRTIQMLLTEAEANGMTELDEEHQETLDESLEALKENVAESDYATTGKYLQYYYGKGMNYNLYVKMLTMVQLAAQYSEKIENDYTDSYTTEDLESYYSEHADEYDRFTYRSYTVSYTVEEEETTDDTADTTDTTATDDTAETDEAAAAKATAEAIAAATSEREFQELVYENCSEDVQETYDPDAEADATLNEKKYGSDISSNDYADWLYDSARTAGDTTVIEGSDGASYIVVYFIDRDTNQENLVNVRHILIAFEDEDDTTTDDTTEEDTEDAAEEDTVTDAVALAKAEEILAEWKAGDATEDSFAALAVEYSADTGSADDGGLYEDVYPGQMVIAFNDWIFDKSRKDGDVDIVETTYGYHIMYFVGESDEVYWHYMAEKNKLSEEYDAWESEQLENYTASTKFFIRWSYSSRH